jgi:hypothetical protein
MKDLRQCLSSFIQEQKSFNQHIEQHMMKASSSPSTIDPVFNQFQQQVITQGLIVNLNTAYREIAVLQTEINGLQTENHRLTASLSSMDRSNAGYSRDHSKESIYSLDKMKNNRAHVRTRAHEHVKDHGHRLKTTNKFENSSRTSFNSQSTDQQTAIHVSKLNMETTPIKRQRDSKSSVFDMNIIHVTRI